MDGYGENINTGPLIDAGAIDYDQVNLCLLGSKATRKSSGGA